MSHHEPGCCDDGDHPSPGPWFHEGLTLHKGIIRGWVSVSLLALLTACTTVPPTPAGSARSPLPTASSATRPASPEAAGTPADTASPSGWPSSNQPRPALLAGEPAREFERGSASWYGPGFHGRRTASGERYDMHALTAAHRTLPFGTMVRVHSLVNGREVDLRITDRGPFSHNRVIDVSRAAAEELGMLGLGFKEVVLLVPESMPAAVEAPPPPARKTRRAIKQVVRPKAR